MCQFTCVVLTTLLALGSAPAGDDVAKKDLQLFQGSWQAVFIQNVDGQRAPDEDVRATRLLVHGNEFTLMVKDVTVYGTFTIDPTKTPKAIDVTLKGAKPGEKFLGVYQIDGEIRRSSFALPGNERPRAVRPSAKGYVMLEWKRLLASADR